MLKLPISKIQFFETYNLAQYRVNGLQTKFTDLSIKIIQHPIGLKFFITARDKEGRYWIFYKDDCFNRFLG